MEKYEVEDGDKTNLKSSELLRLLGLQRNKPNGQFSNEKRVRK